MVNVWTRLKTSTLKALLSPSIHSPIFQRGEAHTSENGEPGWEQETSTAE